MGRLRCIRDCELLTDLKGNTKKVTVGHIVEVDEVLYMDEDEIWTSWMGADVFFDTEHWELL